MYFRCQLLGGPGVQALAMDTPKLGRLGEDGSGWKGRGGTVKQQVDITFKILFLKDQTFVEKGLNGRHFCATEN